MELFLLLNNWVQMYNNQSNHCLSRGAPPLWSAYLCPCEAVIMIEGKGLICRVSDTLRSWHVFNFYTCVMIFINSILLCTRLKLLPWLSIQIYTKKKEIFFIKILTDLVLLCIGSKLLPWLSIQIYILKKKVFLIKV